MESPRKRRVAGRTLKLAAVSIAASAVVAASLVPAAEAVAPSGNADLDASFVTLAADGSIVQPDEAQVLVAPRRNTATGGQYEAQFVVNGVTWAVNEFSASGSFTPSDDMDINYLIIGGGGGGGGTGGTTADQLSGGGGGGGFVAEAISTSTCASPPCLTGPTPLGLGLPATGGDLYPASIGAGGDGATPPTTYQGGSGSSSTFYGVSAGGGGGGGSGRNRTTYGTETNGLVGNPLGEGSGGGGGTGLSGNVGQGGTADTETLVYAYMGGNGNGRTSLTSGGGGGGGAGDQASNASFVVKSYLGSNFTVGRGGSGGQGYFNTAMSSTELWAGGGGGGVGLGRDPGPASTLGSGGGGGGGNGGLAGDGSPGFMGGGGGGGGGTKYNPASPVPGATTAGGFGADGLVRVRFRRFPDNPSAPVSTSWTSPNLAWTTPEYIPAVSGALTRYYVAYRVSNPDIHAGGWNTFAYSNSSLPLTFVVTSTKTACEDANDPDTVGLWTCMLQLTKGANLASGTYDFAVFGASSLPGQIHISEGIVQYVVS